MIHEFVTGLSYGLGAMAAVIIGYVVLRFLDEALCL